MKIARKRWANFHDRRWRHEFIASAVWDVLVFAVVLCALLAVCGRANSQCYIDPNTGQRVCPDSPGVGVGVNVGGVGAGVSIGGPAVTPLPARCRVYAGDGSCGSGTLVYESDIGVVLTAAHVVRDGPTGVRCEFPDGRNFTAVVLEQDSQNDLAALAIRPTGIAPATVSATDPSGVVIAGGFGGRGAFNVVRGQIVGYVRPGGATQVCAVLQGEGHTIGGDSGGAVVNEAREVCGVVWGADGVRTYFTCGPVLRNFVQRVLHGRRVIAMNPQPPWQPTQPQPVPITPPGATQPEQPHPAPQPIPQPDPPRQDNSLADKLAHEIAAIREDIAKLPAGKQGPPGPPGPPGQPGANGLPGASGQTPDTSKFATREDIAATVAGRVARDGATLALGTLGVSTGLAGVVAFFVGRMAARKVRHVFEQHQTAAGGTPREPFLG